MIRVDSPTRNTKVFLDERIWKYAEAPFRPLLLIHTLGVSARVVKKKRLIISAVLTVLVAAYVISVISKWRHRLEWNRTVAALQSLPYERLETAVQAFKRDRKPTDTTVPLRELVSDGYLRAEDVQDLTDRNILVSLTANEMDPQSTLIRVHATDGTDIVLLIDGSVQQETRR